MTRRKLGLAAAAIAVSGRAFATAVEDNPIAGIERRHGGRLGVHVAEVGASATLSHRADERFALASTFKGPLAAFVLSRVDEGEDQLEAEVAYGAADLLPASPVTAAHVGERRMSLEALCTAILQVSDNTAANLLMRRAGGPKALTGFLRRIGDVTTRVDHYEPVPAQRSGTMDSTTPRAMAASAQTTVFGTVLSNRSREWLEARMIENHVGKTRLRASFPAPWVVADRTGTNEGQCNDYAIVRAPGRPSLVMAAYYEATGMSTEDQERVLREVGAAIVQWASR